MSAELLGVVEARAEALVGRDWDVVETLLHPDFCYTNSRGERLDKRAYLEFLERGPLRWRRQWLEGVSVVRADPVAVVTGTVVDDVLVDGQPHLLRFATTQTYLRQDDRWHYLAGHTSPLADD